MGLVNLSLNTFIDGMVALHRNDMAMAQKKVEEIARLRKRNTPKTLDGDLTMCYAPGTMPKKTREARISLILENQLQASVLTKQGRKEEAEVILRETVELEAATSFSFGPPIIAKPSSELYGEFLLADNRPGEALVQFEKVFERAPKRTLSLKGYAAAATRSNNPVKAAEARDLINQIVKTEN